MYIYTFYIIVPTYPRMKSKKLLVIKKKCVSEVGIDIFHHLVPIRLRWSFYFRDYGKRPGITSHTLFLCNRRIGGKLLF